MTEKLYYKDSHMREFTAKVISCEDRDGKYSLVLDRTAFFPEGGGQAADMGTIEDANVFHVSEKGDVIEHISNKYIEPGSEVCGKIDWQRRFRLMQGHSGEHILSGTVHKMYGFENVGFHMGEDGIIVDFSGYLTKEQLQEIELEVNRRITEDLPVTQSFPSPEELKDIEYRSKLDITENVRLVTVEGVDICACCAPHVKRTGEIGVFKILESIRRRDGVRVRMLAGSDALENYRKKSKSVSEISAMLSAREDGVVSAVERIQREKSELEWNAGALVREIIGLIADGAGETEGNMLFFRKNFSVDEQRLLVNALLEKCGGMCAVFSEKGDGYAYVIGSRTKNMRDEVKSINLALSGRGGGTPEMVSGSVAASQAEIAKYFLG